MSNHQALIELSRKNTLPTQITYVRPIKVGVLAAPGLAADKTEQIYKELANLLHHHVDDRQQWLVFSEMDPLIGAKDNTTRILAKAREHKIDKNWDYAICITDLPMLREHQFTAAEASNQHGIAVLSLPTLGCLRLKRRLREAFLQLVNELYHGSSFQARQRQQKHTQEQRRHRREHGLRNHNARKLIAGGPMHSLAPIRRRRIQQDQREIDVRFVSVPQSWGFITVLTGMIRANQPLNIIPTFRRVLAVAFATGAYGLLFKTLWLLSDAYDTQRLIALMIGAVIAMVIWLIIDHDLWAMRSQRGSPILSRLHNITTLLTLLIGVICYYAILFIFFLIAVLLLVTPDLFKQTLEHAVNMKHYLMLTWLATSVATVAGALGASLENSQTIRNATYGYRQRARYQKAQEAKRFQPDDQGDA